jgi:hypothetical protein
MEILLTIVTIGFLIMFISGVGCTTAMLIKYAIDYIFDR